jgi:aldose 1-epimerase
MPATSPPELFTLQNSSGMEIEILNHGGTVKALRVPDSTGRIDDVVLGFDRADEYLGPHPYFGGIVGRYGNRIAGGRFRIDGREHVLACNDGPNHLHGGARGFDRVRWSVEPKRTATGSSLVLGHTSVDGEEGYPGTLACEVTYTLTEANEFRIDYLATTDRPTVLNLTHHSYFNLAGGHGGDVLGHQLFVDAHAFTPVNASLVPTGEIRPVAETAFDLRQPMPIGLRMNQTDEQIALARGYDHNFVLNRPADPSTPRLAARLLEPRSGRVMEVWTTEPGLQVYAGGGLDGSITGKGGRTYGRHAGLCLETQHFPDSPNQPGFPSVRLDPGRAFTSVTIYRFSTAP